MHFLTFHFNSSIQTAVRWEDTFDKRCLLISSLQIELMKCLALLDKLPYALNCKGSLKRAVQNKVCTLSVIGDSVCYFLCFGSSTSSPQQLQINL